MAATEVFAYAKLNLSLDVLDKRPDGYHEMKMVMQTVTLRDRIALETGTGRPLEMRSNLGFLPADEHNLAAAAALALCRETGTDPGGLSIKLDKTIPVCAGMAGGSADAAAVLRGLNEVLGLGLSQTRLEEIGALVGSDVPYCVGGGTALAEGRGEILTSLPSLPRCHVVLCKPAFSVSTPELFRALDGCRIRRRPDTAGLIDALAAGDLPGVARRMYNVFEDVLPQRRYQEICTIKNVLIQHGALGASMSGTGPTVFGLFDRQQAAEDARAALAPLYRETFLVESMGTLMEKKV
ncbi:4-(cytidine 5'-diphospho)-2-C-methyl-D-erythritol kinase [Flavonifractor sp. HCP28S3_F3]|uniref:4-(cytidine 5'-diphospho)-2-C-methyl-D-erythritol kinase n=1 Tax=Flavonifractor sp. HCP28S3_F3 TaxID=3438939 RepID=UPI003F898673